MLQDEIYIVIAKLVGSSPGFGDITTSDMIAYMKDKRCVYVSLRHSFDTTMKWYIQV